MLCINRFSSFSCLGKHSELFSTRHLQLSTCFLLLAEPLWVSGTTSQLMGSYFELPVVSVLLTQNNSGCKIFMSRSMELLSWSNSPNTQWNFDHVDIEGHTVHLSVCYGRIEVWFGSVMSVGHVLCVRVINVREICCTGHDIRLILAHLPV